jgi:hypothetical protein
MLLLPQLRRLEKEARHAIGLWREYVILFSDQQLRSDNILFNNKGAAYTARFAARELLIQRGWLYRIKAILEAHHHSYDDSSSAIQNAFRDLSHKIQLVLEEPIPREAIRLVRESVFNQFTDSNLTTYPEGSLLEAAKTVLLETDEEVVNYARENTNRLIFEWLHDFDAVDLFAASSWQFLTNDQKSFFSNSHGDWVSRGHDLRALARIPEFHSRLDLLCRSFVRYFSVPRHARYTGSMTGNQKFNNAYWWWFMIHQLDEEAFNEGNPFLLRDLKALWMSEISESSTPETFVGILSELNRALKDLGALAVRRRLEDGDDILGISGTRINLIPSPHLGQCHPLLLVISLGAGDFKKRLAAAEAACIRCDGSTGAAIRLVVFVTDYWENRYFVEERLPAFAAFQSKRNLRLLLILRANERFSVSSIL